MRHWVTPLLAQRIPSAGNSYFWRTAFQRSQKIHARRAVESVFEVTAQRSVHLGNEPQVRQLVVSVVIVVAEGGIEPFVAFPRRVVGRAGIQRNRQVAAQEAHDGLRIERDIPFDVIRRRRRASTGAKVKAGESLAKQLRLPIVGHRHATGRAKRHEMHRSFRLPQRFKNQFDALLLKRRCVEHPVLGRFHPGERNGAARDVASEEAVELQHGDEARLARPIRIGEQARAGILR